MEGTFKDDRLSEGKIYENGILIKEGNFNLFHQLMGKGKKYYDYLTLSHEQGNLSIEGNFENDDLNGEGKIYWTNSNLRVDGTFKDGYLNGEGKIYDENGNLQIEGIFERTINLDLYLIKGKIYDENGNLKAKGNFKNKGKMKISPTQSLDDLLDIKDYYGLPSAIDIW